VLITRDQLIDVAKSELAFSSFSESYILDEKRYEVGVEYDVFISHSSADKKLVLGTKLFFEKKGFSVYIDWVNDPNLDRQSVSATTANFLKMRMRQSKTLVYAHTEQSTVSKWCPWELGFFDGLKSGNVFILPIADKKKWSFEGQEYLELYPYLDEYGVLKDSSSEIWINNGDGSPYFRKAMSSTINKKR
jgi:hypothetical protein